MEAATKSGNTQHGNGASIRMALTPYMMPRFYLTLPATEGKLNKQLIKDKGKIVRV
uniref:Uncharacterized protein n=1 Tax=viral metagenome TaxID=1070528 RepID=A0A6M3K469_9ZZZZ